MTFAGRDVECSEQIGRTVPGVGRGRPLGLAEHQRQQGLVALQGLNLGLLVEAQHDGVVGGMQVQADDVAHLLDEELVVAQGEAASPMRLEMEGAPYARHRRLDHPGEGRIPGGSGSEARTIGRRRRTRPCSQRG
jgi:hypothetical protein